MSGRLRYSRWDGSQVGFDLDAGQVLAELTDDLLYSGDVHAALRRMLQQGLRDRNGERVQGVRDALERLRQARRERLAAHDLGGVFDDIAEALRDVVATERASLDELVAEARASDDHRRRELTEQVVADKHTQLDLLPPDLAGLVRDLERYEFTSTEARERFEELLAELRQQLVARMVDQMAGALRDLTGDDLARMKDMLADLNALLEQRARGEEPDFEDFMRRHGDYFPERPSDLDEMLEVMARRMAAAQAMLNSMAPGQRDQLRSLSDQLLDDLDLRWQVDQLGEHLRAAFPQMGWSRSYDFEGQDPLGFAEAVEVLSELGELDQLEQLLRGATSPGALAEVDFDRARSLLGEETAASLERLAEMTRMLEEAGLIRNTEGRYELTPAGIRRIGQQALADLFRSLDRDRLGRHELHRVGAGHERDLDTKAYEWGDPFNLHIERTVRNAVRRSGGGTPVSLSPEDFEVERTEQQVRASTVLMLDLSLSMPMRDNFLPAKKVAMALHSLISSRFSRDWLGMVGFSESARELKAEELPAVSWDFVYGTNMQHAFQISRRLLARQAGSKQIIMITDGEPTAHLRPDGEVFFAYPPTRETVDLTLAEVVRCTRDGIRINTFMLDPTPHLRAFVEKLTELNRGRAFFTTADTLGDYVLVDFLEQRRALVRSRRAG